MITKIVSGGQTGADQAGLRAARGAGIPTGGWAPLGWDTESGPAPWLAEWGLVECQEPGYPAHQSELMQDSDATVWFGSIQSPGYIATSTAAYSQGRPFLIIRGDFTRPSDMADWLTVERIAVLNVAGNRESGNPGIGERVERFLAAVFERMAG